MAEVKMVQPKTLEEAFAFFNREAPVFQPGDEIRQIWLDAEGDPRYRYPAIGKTAKVLKTVSTVHPRGDDTYKDETVVVTVQTANGTFERFPLDPIFFEKAE